MFFLAKIKKNVTVPATMIHLTRKECVTTILNQELANKVVLNVGLCIALHSLAKDDNEDSFLPPGLDGAVLTCVTFKYVVFRPFIDEILVGTIKNCNREGVQITLGFFDDIFIPPNQLQHPSKFNEMEQTWVWEYNTEDGVHELVMDKEDKIRFRVTTETFRDISPNKPGFPLDQDCLENQVPYSLTASINEPGLGLLRWWTN